MFIKQLSVFIENQEGRLEQVLEVLKQEGIPANMGFCG